MSSKVQCTGWHRPACNCLCRWDAFANEFFEDEAQLTLTFCLEDGPKRYSKLNEMDAGIEPVTSSAVGRTLIPRFFRSIFEGGVTELQWELRHAKESFHQVNRALKGFLEQTCPQATVSLDCDQATMVTQHGKPMFTKVYTEGRLIVEFNFDDLLRIRSWHFAIRNHRELIPRSVIAMQVRPPANDPASLLTLPALAPHHPHQEPGMVETLSKNITRQGLTATTLNYLRVSTNAPGRLEDLPTDEDTPLPAVSTVVGSGTPGPLPSGPNIDSDSFQLDSFQFQ